MFIPFVNGVPQTPGFPRLERAIQYFSPMLAVHRAMKNTLVISYSERAPDGNRAQFYDWHLGEWIKVPCDQRGAYILATRGKITG